jgi:hypothetical protein
MTTRAQILITAVDETRRAFQSVQGRLARLRKEAAPVGEVLARLGRALGASPMAWKLYLARELVAWQCFPIDREWLAENAWIGKAERDRQEVIIQAGLTTRPAGCGASPARTARSMTSPR